jgi:lipopolysaccharide export system ATP-binding protein
MDPRPIVQTRVPGDPLPEPPVAPKLSRAGRAPKLSRAMRREADRRAKSGAAAAVQPVAPLDASPGATADPAPTPSRIVVESAAPRRERPSEALDAAPLDSAAPATLAAEGLVKTYRGRAVVNGISLDVRPLEIVGLLGPNGAGKTTSFYMIVGVVRPDAGTILLGDRDVTRLPMHERARLGVGYLPQERSVFRRLSVEDNLMGVLQQTPLKQTERVERMEQALEELGLTHIRKAMGFQLSGGESRRVEIARSLVLRPHYILLDEPFAGVDPIAVLDIQGVIRQIRDRGIGVLITDHNVRETLGITDRAYIINQGQVLVQGTPTELANNEVARRIYLGERFTL